MLPAACFSLPAWFSADDSRVLQQPVTVSKILAKMTRPNLFFVLKLGICSRALLLVCYVAGLLAYASWLAAGGRFIFVVSLLAFSHGAGRAARSNAVRGK